jgi:hypothetical protein
VRAVREEEDDERRRWRSKVATGFVESREIKPLPQKKKIRRDQILISRSELSGTPGASLIYFSQYIFRNKL